MGSIWGAYRPLTAPRSSIRIVSLLNECVEKVNNETNSVGSFNLGFKIL